MSTKPKILHVVEPFATGVLSFLLALTHHQVEDYDVVIAYGVRPQTPPDVEKLVDPRVKLIRIKGFDGSPTRSLLNVKTYLEVRRIFRAENPDIVHMHASVAWFVGRIAIPHGKTKLFYSPHAFSFLSRVRPKWSNVIVKFFEKGISWHRCKIIACSLSEYQTAQRLTSNCTYIDNGVDMETLDECKKNITLSTPSMRSVYTVGKITPQKNPELFNEIALRLPDYSFLWIGDGSEVHHLTAPNIKVTGWMAQQEALQLSAQSGIFMLTSHYEGLPISLLEAMYLRKVCIVSDVAGNADVISTNHNGYVCQTVSDFVAAIVSVTENPQQTEELTLQAKSDIELHYNTAVMAMKYSKIYNEK